MEKTKINKKGQNQLNIAIAIGIGLLVIAGLVIATAAFRDTQTAGSVASNVLNETVNMYDNLSEQLPTVGTILGVAILIGVIVGSFLVGRFLTQRFR